MPSQYPSPLVHGRTNDLADDVEVVAVGCVVNVALPGAAPPVKVKAPLVVGIGGGGCRFTHVSAYIEGPEKKETHQPRPNDARKLDAVAVPDQVAQRAGGEQAAGVAQELAAVVSPEQCRLALAAAGRHQVRGRAQNRLAAL